MVVSGRWTDHEHENGENVSGRVYEINAAIYAYLHLSSLCKCLKFATVYARDNITHVFYVYSKTVASAVGRRIIMKDNKFGLRAGDIKTVRGEDKSGQ